MFYIETRRAHSARPTRSFRLFAFLLWRRLHGHELPLQLVPQIRGDAQDGPVEGRFYRDTGLEGTFIWRVCGRTSWVCDIVWFYQMGLWKDVIIRIHSESSLAYDGTVEGRLKNGPVEGRFYLYTARINLYMTGLWKDVRGLLICVHAEDGPVEGRFYSNT